ncbi:hypothetical protein Gbem_2770 [Citrifermentans bemidjiense Bem]|uniref:Uncharacterized protein n=1 Tax=Citrifermentans bemidjiense (strain ATCC BAA-1014 / DSM 16622 / JCM 12645 / Bem) TaxID=404380 RepID=B5EHX5_CITBB|nr:hypothetical protein [Citrifermentans bemidjiense]ACH39774.1 hypothetical protein Gbem_2770 [Citrifermentans bemidjiense Bem]
MVRTILEIGNAKYEINCDALKRFMREARQSAVLRGELEDDKEKVLTYAAGAKAPVEASIDMVFDEVLQLYNEYARTEDLVVLVQLKSKLEQVSLRYKSLALAEEVLNINSCLPYELRVNCSQGKGGIQGES